MQTNVSDFSVTCNSAKELIADCLGIEKDDELLQSLATTYEELHDYECELKDYKQLEED